MIFIVWIVFIDLEQKNLDLNRVSRDSSFTTTSPLTIRDICAKFCIPYFPQSPDIGQNVDGDISDVWLSGQSLVKVNFHNSRTSDDIDMKLVPVTKFDQRNKTVLKLFDDSVIFWKFWRHCYLENMRPIWNNLESRCRMCSL